MQSCSTKKKQIFYCSSLLEKSFKICIFASLNAIVDIVDQHGGKLVAQSRCITHRLFAGGFRDPFSWQKRIKTN